LKTKIAYIISNINKALAFEWIATYLNQDKFELHFLLLNPNNSALEDFLKDRGIPVTSLLYKDKSDLPKSIWGIYQYLKQHQIQIIHCHLFEACLTGLLAAKIANVNKRIHTRHHSTLHHTYFPRAVFYDRFINWLSTDIVAISENVANVLHNKEAIPLEKVSTIQHGFILSHFEDIPKERITILQNKYLIDHTLYPVIGVIARYTEWKGIQYIIEAFKQLLLVHPDALLVLANARGDYQPAIQILLNELPTKSYVEIPFEDDIFALYHLFHLFLHVPIDKEIEAFGQTYVEALAAGIPSIFTLSGVAREFIQDEYNALVVPFQDPGAILQAMHRLLTSPELVQKLVSNGKKSVYRRFTLQQMMQKLEDLYLSP
jgi:glycosyltransferase involved in cell wall biosynthesis